MLAYLVRRLLFALVLVFTVSSASLLLTRLAPGDYASDALGIGASRQRVEEMRARYGLDRPIARAVPRLARPARCGSISAGRWPTTGRWPI